VTQEKSLLHPQAGASRLMAASVLSLLHFWFVVYFRCVAVSRAR